MKKENNAGGKSVRPIPEGFHTVTTYLMVKEADTLIEFLKNGFDAKETFMARTEDNEVMHAIVTIGDSTMMISDAMGMPEQKGMLFLYVDDVDTVFEKAVAAHGTVVREVKDEFYGDRAGAIKDPCGNTWWIATHIKDVDEAELKKLARQESKNQTKKPDEVEA